MYSKWGNITHRAGLDVVAGTLLTLNENMEYVLASASTATAIFVAVADAKQGEPLAAQAISASTGGAEVTAIAGTYNVGAKVYAAANGKVSASGDVVIGYYHGETITLSGDAVIEIIFA